MKTHKIRRRKNLNRLFFLEQNFLPESILLAHFPRDYEMSPSVKLRARESWSWLIFVKTEVVETVNKGGQGWD